MHYTIELPQELSRFYSEVASQAGLPVERVLADALYKLAGELSFQALHKNRQSGPMS